MMQSVADLPNDFRFQVEEELSDLVSASSRFKYNVAAIRLLKKIEVESREAGSLTLEERRVLARYTGWGDSDVLNRAFPNGAHSWSRPCAELAPGKEHLTSSQRGELLSRIATSDYDAIIIPQTAFKMLQLNPETVRNYIRHEIDTLTGYLEDFESASEKNKRSIKEVQRAIKKLKARLDDTNQQIKRIAADTITWDELGIDALFIDEFHCYKNLYCPTKMSRVAGSRRPKLRSHQSPIWRVQMSTNVLPFTPVQFPQESITVPNGHYRASVAASRTDRRVEEVERLPFDLSALEEEGVFINVDATGFGILDRRLDWQALGVELPKETDVAFTPPRCGLLPNRYRRPLLTPVSQAHAALHKYSYQFRLTETLFETPAYRRVPWRAFTEFESTFNKACDNLDEARRKVLDQYEEVRRK